jgi:hypothetical protein
LQKDIQFNVIFLNFVSKIYRKNRILVDLLFGN